MKCEKCGGETSILHNGICFDCAAAEGTLPKVRREKCVKCGKEVGLLIDGVCGDCAFDLGYYVEKLKKKKTNPTEPEMGKTRPCVVEGTWKGIWHGWVKAAVEFYGIVEDEAGDIYRVKCESIRFLDTKEQMGKLDPYFERAKGRPDE